MKTSKTEIIENAITAYHLSAPLKVDRRFAAIKNALAAGFTADEIVIARKKRAIRSENACYIDRMNRLHAYRVDFVKCAKKTTYNPRANSSRFNMTGYDYCVFNRASSNGIGWVLIAPDEPSNNVYTEDRVLVSLMRKKAVK